MNHNILEDPYKILGVNKQNTQEEIKKAYYRLARKYHPDKHENKEYATRKIQEINASYEILKNREMNNYDNMTEHEKRVFFYRQFKKNFQEAFPQETNFITSFIQTYYTSGEDLFIDLLEKNYNKIAGTFKEKMMENINKNNL
jgi:curved DNA-binding protein CbpA